MKPEQVNALISAIGLMTQTGGALLLVVLFSALRRSHPRPRPYFREWTQGWAALLAALSGVAAQYVLARQMTEWPPLRAGANFVYQAGKLLFVGFLLAGTLNFVGGVRPRVVLRWVIPVALLYSLLSVLLSGPVLNGVMVLQSPLIVGAFLYCSWVLLRLPASRTTLGSRITGSVFAGIALLWIAYAVAFALARFPARAATGRRFDILLYNSYFDLLFQLLLEEPLSPRRERP